MKFLSSLDPKDRRLLLWSCLASPSASPCSSAFVLPNGNNNDNPMPSTYLSGQHGARAAYESLRARGLQHRALGAAAWRTGSALQAPNTVVIFAQPFSRESGRLQGRRDRLWSEAVACWQLASGAATWCPAEIAGTPKEFAFAACQLEPEGLDALANYGEVWMVPEATWQVGNPSAAHSVQLRRAACGGGVRLRQRARGVVGQFHAARKWIIGSRRQS